MQSQLLLPVAKVKCKFPSLLGGTSANCGPRAHLQLANLLHKFCPESQKTLLGMK